MVDNEGANWSNKDILCKKPISVASTKLFRKIGSVMSVSKELWLLLVLCVLSIDGKLTLDGVVGGSNADDTEFPYQASIRNLGDHICGASVIHERYILTAAHCLYGQDLDELTVVLGSNRLSTGGDTYYVEELIINELFDSSESRNDVGLLKLNKTIVFKENVKKIDLTTRNTPAGVECVLTGWGEISDSGPIPDKLQKLDLVTISLTQCKIAYMVREEILPDRGNLCTLAKKGQGACFGDSGSPLVNIATKQQIGIVSKGTPCAVGQPDIYTNVYKYSDWINKKLLAK